MHLYKIHSSKIVLGINVESREVETTPKKRSIRQDTACGIAILYQAKTEPIFYTIPDPPHIVFTNMVSGHQIDCGGT